MIAVNDGKIVRIGQTPQLGRYVELQDATGNIYTYAHLGSISKRYPVPKPVKVTAKQIAQGAARSRRPRRRPPRRPAGRRLPGPSAERPTVSKAAIKPHRARRPAVTGRAAATRPRTPRGGHRRRRLASTAASSATGGPGSAAGQSDAATVTAPMVKERLFANPNRPASYAAGGNLQLKNSAQQITNFRNYFSDTLHLAKNQYTLQPLKEGAIVVAGTILGRIGGPSQGVSSHLYFMIQPAGKNAPYIDPKPILDGWKLLEATAVYRAAGVDPFFGPGAKNPSVGQVLLMSKQQLDHPRAGRPARADLRLRPPRHRGRPDRPARPGRDRVPLGLGP